MPLSGNLVGRLAIALRDPDAAQELATFLEGFEVLPTNTYTKARATNATDTSFPARPPTLTEPTGEGVHDLDVTTSGRVANGVVVVPYGTGDENDVFEMKVILWRSTAVGSGQLWLPTTATATPFICTLSTAVGTSGGDLTASERVCDTITNADTDITSQTQPVAIVSPTGNIPGSIRIFTYGAAKVEFIFDSTTGDPTGMNALFVPI
jgi:hypothetical protein